LILARSERFSWTLHMPVDTDNLEIDSLLNAVTGFKGLWRIGEYNAKT